MCVSAHALVQDKVWKGKANLIIHQRITDYFVRATGIVSDTMCFDLINYMMSSCEKLWREKDACMHAYVSDWTELSRPRTTSAGRTHPWAGGLDEDETAVCPCEQSCPTVRGTDEVILAQQLI